MAWKRGSSSSSGLGKREHSLDGKRSASRRSSLIQIGGKEEPKRKENYFIRRGGGLSIVIALQAGGIEGKKKSQRRACGRGAERRKKGGMGFLHDGREKKDVICALYGAT